MSQSKIILSCSLSNVNKSFDANILSKECIAINDLIEGQIDNDNQDEIVIPLAVDWSLTELNFLANYIHNRKHYNLPTIEKPLYKPLKSILSISDSMMLDDISDNHSLERLIMMANFLNCQGLMDILCAYTAEKLKNLNVQEILDFFGLEDDLTEEDREKIKTENNWFDHEYYHQM